MWIVPKTLSRYVPATPGLNLVSSEQAWMLEQSVTWRSKFMSKQYWSKRWKKGDYVQHLCGLMPKPSLHQSFVEKYTASLPDIHVSRLVAQGSEKEKTTQDTCGHTSESMSGQLDLFGASLKMSEATPRWGYGESCPIWKKMVTERSGDCSARRKQARLTNASECSSWPTPRAGNPGSRKPGTGGKILAEEAKKNWYTPDCSDRRSAKSKQQGLSNQAKQLAGPPAQEKSSTIGKNQESWPTPRVGGHEKAETSIKRGRGVSLTGAVAKDATQTPKLNPNWVEQLMGLPIGWTDLGSWGTESSHKQQN
jgi:hypothetical protein